MSVVADVVVVVVVVAAVAAVVVVVQGDAIPSACELIMFHTFKQAKPNIDLINYMGPISHTIFDRKSRPVGL